MKNGELTQNEIKILILITKGYTNKEIANFLNISYYTIKSELEILYTKLGVKNRIQAVVMYIKSLKK